MTANKDKHAYKLLSNEVVSLGWLGDREMNYLERLAEDADANMDYFSLLEAVRGGLAYPLMKFDGVVTEEAIQSVLFRVASDIVERAGIRQGRCIHLEDSRDVRGLVTAAQACEIMDVTRGGMHFLLTKGRIKGWKIGKLWLVDRKSAEQHRDNRQNIGEASKM